jgi:exopolyphosphatase/pppGpp-phosphohydrolase
MGGGSIQFAVGEGAACRYRATLPLGVLRLVSVPRFRDLVRREAAAVCRSVAAFEPAELVFASGTARLAARMALEGGAPSLTREMTLPLGKTELEEMSAALARLDRYALIALGVRPGRADTIGLGAAVMATIMDLVGFRTASVAEQGLREGVIVRALRDENARSACPPVLAAHSVHRLLHADG